MIGPTRGSVSQVALLVGGVALALALAAPLAARAAAQSPPATIEVPMRDPWVPPELRNPTARPASQGATLRDQVERKLKAGFDTADVQRTGTVTREQARAAGQGFIVKHFDEIDRQLAGAVTFDEVKQFLRGRGAQLD
jgi:hypothetical protein